MLIIAFYFTVQTSPQPTAHGPELIFHTKKCREQASVLLSVICDGTPSIFFWFQDQFTLQHARQAHSKNVILDPKGTGVNYCVSVLHYGQVSTAKRILEEH